ncbi:type IV secretory system conjugative DNA transfer family protein [Massilia sp. H6]|uniref:type IV secretory system conjugative DNA transfer family protein n=1 Tax=Massilia sp. H6 TaxID=2970464 RepID=UPI00216748C5|nr:type IV secretory system conjugative DNA transfer family protein [Massilia sp. H6]UVW30690.1 type IV secretory system conjugative DNA transfer family protein [Massilia sp. H6]
MTLSSSDSRWRKPSLIVLGLLAACVLWAYLGGGIFMVAHRHKFEDATPLTLYQYWVYYGAEQSVVRWLIISAAIAFVVTAAPALLLLKPAKRSLFGDARWAKSADIRKAGLLGTKGIVVGLYRRTYLMFEGSQHVILSAPTRSGKGVGIVIPNLLTWSDSVVVLDIKQENHGITSAYRRKYGQPCFLFNPAAADYRTHRYNPLAYISEDPNFRIDDTQKIANMLFPDQQGVDPIWTATPRSLFLGIVLYLLETPGKLVTLGQVLRESLADGDGAKYFTSIIAARNLGERIAQTGAQDAALQAARDVEAILADKGKAPQHHPKLSDMAVWLQLSPPYRGAVAEALELARKDQARTPDLIALAEAMPIDAASCKIGKGLSGACVRALNSYISIAAETTRAGIMTGFRSRLELWYNPLVDAATSANDFDLRDVRKKRMSIYLGVTPDNLDRMAPLLNLFFQQLIDLNTRELPEQNAALKYQCLLLADEFTAMGKIQVLSKGISYIAGYGLRMLPIIQSPAQVVEVYGKHAAETFTTNHALQIVFPPKATESETAESISKWLGYQTVKGVSESKGKALFAKREKSESISDQRRALLLPQEITSLGKTSEIVVVEDCPPILAHKIRYYEDRTFVDRLKTVSPSLAALGRKLPNQQQLKEAIRRGELGAPVPLIDLETHHQTVGIDTGFHMQPPGTGQGGVLIATTERAVTADDVHGLNALALTDFVVDFSAVEVPKGELDEVALQAYADQLCRQAGVAV